MATPLPPEVLPPELEALGGIGGLLTPREDYVPNIQSAYGAIIQNAPDYQYFTAPLSNQGRATASYGTTNQIVVAPDTPIRLVNNATGEVVASGTGYEGAQAAIDAANALAASAGKKANYDIQVVRPGGQSFESVSTERPDVSGLGILADVALPVAGSLLAGPLGLGALGLGAAGTAAAGAALGSGLSSVAQGRSIEDALLRAAIAGGGSYLGSQLLAPTASTGGINADLIPGALAGENALNFGSIASTAIPAGVGGAATSGLGDIIVTALGGVPVNIAGAFGPLATSLLPSAFDAAQINNAATMDQMSTTEQPSDYVITAQVPTTTPTVTPPVVLPPNAPPFDPTEDIDVTAKNTTKVTPTPPVVIPPSTTTTPPFSPTEDLVVTAKDTRLPPIAPPVVVPPGIIPPSTGPGSTTTTKDNTVLGTGLTATQLATLGALGLGGLLGGSGTGGSSTTGTYVSPFGPGAGFNFGAGTTMDYRATPTAIDYERYGFGPEAYFFRPEYSQLIGMAAPATASSPSPSDIAQIYKPLI